MRKIETALESLPEVKSARANLSNRRVLVRWDRAESPPNIWQTLNGIGFESHLYTPGENADGANHEFTLLLRDLAVSGFAAGNIMMLSMSVWYGATHAYSAAFHWISALLAFFALTIAGRTFFKSAIRALAAGSTNMDVPISVGLVLTFAVSLYDTVIGTQYVYFDAASMLLFFLLIGRTLDHLARNKANETVRGLESLLPSGVRVVESNDSHRFVPLNEVEPGMVVAVGAGEIVAVDGTVLKGASDVDASLVSGESTPVPIVPQSRLVAGMRNLSVSITMEVVSTADNSFVAQMSRMMEVAESNRSRYRALSDKVSRLYTPVVHLAALAAFAIWISQGSDLHRSIQVAVSVLIITCPCALALAVPTVNTVASARLFKGGVFVSSATAFERMSEIDTVVFDKTGTLTTAKPSAHILEGGSQHNLSLARQLAAHSHHPNSVALVRSIPASTQYPPVDLRIVREVPGKGVEARSGVHTYRLGHPEWALANCTGADACCKNADVVLSMDGTFAVSFEIAGALISSARCAVRDLKEQGFALAILSGNKRHRVARIAADLGVDVFRAEQTPEDKLRFVEQQQRSGRRILMVGDGLNDTPSLAGADVAMTPSNAADIGRSHADFVFLEGRLESVGEALRVSRFAQSLTRQNIALAVLYNVVAVPLAFLGFVTPLIAAIAMSTSSVLVVLNALRLQWWDSKSALAWLPENNKIASEPL